jgi:hypothetical protein
MVSGMSQDELDIIAYLERDLGRELSPQEIYVALEQAAGIGVIERPVRH